MYVHTCMWRKCVCRISLSLSLSVSLFLSPSPSLSLPLSLCLRPQGPLTVFTERLSGWSHDGVQVPAAMLGSILETGRASEQGRRAITQLVRTKPPVLFLSVSVFVLRNQTSARVDSFICLLCCLQPVLQIGHIEAWVFTCIIIMCYIRSV